MCILYMLIKKYYFRFTEDLKTKVDLETQNLDRTLLNTYICRYIADGSKKDISKYCKYYC